MSQFEVVLYEPEIPQNTGNIGRTCVATNARLHLVEPLGYKIEDKYLKRSGLDYWQHLDWHQHPNYAAWLNFKKEHCAKSQSYFLSSKAKKSLWDVEIKPNDIFVFGPETRGLPKPLLDENIENAVCLPQFGPVRSINLATAVAVVLYEARRQTGA